MLVRVEVPGDGLIIGGCLPKVSEIFFGGGRSAPLACWLPPGAAARIAALAPGRRPVPVVALGGGAQPVGTAGSVLSSLPECLLPPGREHLAPHPPSGWSWSSRRGGVGR